ncbi:MAG: sulfite exporter TauE/SafE family protein [Anaerolineae bacterium]
MDLSLLNLLVLGLAAVGAGAVNAIAGGGTLITFPTMVAMGVPPLNANVTNTVSLFPGYLGGTMAQRADLAGQRRRVRLLAPVGVVGGLAGGILLLLTGEALFRILVPWLIIMASTLLLFQDRIRGWVVRRLTSPEQTQVSEAWSIGPVFLASVYGGYFGAGLSVILIAVLGLVIHDNLTRINALKQALSLCVNLAAALFFVFSGKVLWIAVPVMMIGALLGGVLGGRLASRVKASTLRTIVVIIGYVVGVIYLFR